VEIGVHRLMSGKRAKSAPPGINRKGEHHGNITAVTVQAI